MSGPIVKIMKTLIKIIPLLTLTLFLLAPETVSAQLVPLVPLVQCDGVKVECDLCAFVQMFDRIEKWLVAILTLVAVMLMVYAGFKMVSSTGNPSAVQEAKKLLVNVLIGFVIVLAAWVIVDTLLKALMGDTAQVGRIWSPAGQDCGDMGTTTDHTFGFGDPNYPAYHGSPDAGYVPIGPGVSGANCGVSPSAVVPIPGTSESATPATVSNFVAMRSAAASAGITLTVNEGYRSDATQLSYWNKYNCDVNDCSGRVARPCSLGGNGSNHTAGIALDLNTPFNSTAFNWIKANGGTYGFYNNLGSRDPWHWSPTGR